MDNSIHRYFMINKPYDMVSQFISPHKVRLLGELNFIFPAGIHAIGRLDRLSEGLLLLTTNKQITSLLFQSHLPHTRKYLVHVKKEVSTETLEQLRGGVSILIADGKKYITSACNVNIIDPTDTLRNMKQLTDYGRSTWLQIDLREGKYHQVRKMVAAVRHKCIRLIRIAIEEMYLGDLKPGEVLEIEEKVFFKQLKLDK